MERVSQSELARRLGVSAAAISRAIREGRVELGADGLLDPVAGEAQWLRNRRRRPRAVRPSAPAAADQAGVGADFWAAKTAREAAEAEIAAGIEFARLGTDPDPAEVTRDVYSNEAA